MPQTSVADLVWRQATASAAWPERYGHAAAVFDGKMWIMGGSASGSQLLNDLWHSTDGANWTLFRTNNTVWPARTGHSTVVFNGTLWVLGGYTADACSTFGIGRDSWYWWNGADWRLATCESWPGRSGHNSLVLNGRMWVMGGWMRSGGTYGGVNYSADGISWSERDAPWPRRAGAAACVWSNRIWLLGGGSATDSLNDVWSSTNGLSWVQATASAGWAIRRGLACSVFQDRLWVLGGYGLGYLNDVWSSTDGVNWTLDGGRSGWFPREGHGSFEFDGRMWVIGSSGNDVWYTEGDCASPLVSRQPPSQSICAGRDIVVSVQADGDPPMRYQWRRNGVGIPGATLSTYIIESANPANSGGYDVEVSNDCASAISDTAVIVAWSARTGDTNADGVVNGRDIDSFLAAALLWPNGPDGLEFCAADVNADGIVNVLDGSLLVARLLSQ